MAISRSSCHLLHRKIALLTSRTLNLLRHFSTTPPVHSTDYTHTIIGAGAVGLATARQLAQRPGTRTLLLERHAQPGTETSSRNSEVIHAGLYYGTHSLKTRLCIRGRQLLYAYCRRRGIPHRNCGKWIVAQDETQLAALEKLCDYTNHEIGVSTRFLTPDEAARREPDVRADAGVLESSTTGIVDSHAYMQALEGDFAEEFGGELAYGSTVTGVEALGGDGSLGWKLHVADTDSTDSSAASASAPDAASDDAASTTTITTSTVINSAGLAAVHIHNLLYPSPTHPRHLTPYYAKGTYYSYSLSHPKPNTLIYPAPVPGHGGLGTHLTLDMVGRIRFGPDVEWVCDPHDLSPNPDPARLEAALDDIVAYLPGLDREAVALDYCGIRPKLAPRGSAVQGEGFVDFVIAPEEGHSGWVDLLGIESPGLTASLAIAEVVEGILYR